MHRQLALGLPAAALWNSEVMNARCTSRTEDDERPIHVEGFAAYHHCAPDAVGEA
jgi:hypothetical protein